MFLCRKLRFHSAFNMAVFGAVVSCGTTMVLAQNAPSGQNPSSNQQAPVPEEDPMGLPPRTIAPPPPVEVPNQSTPSTGPANGQSTSQGSEGEDQGRFVFKKQVQEVVLHATVVDQDGNLVTYLDRNAFTVFQNGQPEQITSFRREDVPVEIGVVVDNSGSMRDKRQKVAQAVMNLVQISNPGDQVFVVNFNETAYLDQDFTSNGRLLEAALHQVSSRGTTALYDAVVASDIHLRDNSTLQKKALLVVTDGEDNMSRETLQDTIRKLQSKNGPTVYAIGLSDRGMTRSAREALQRLATATGGVAYFPRTLEEVNDITRTIAHDIRSQYTLTYNPGSTMGKGYQTITVDARGPAHKRLTVRTRPGYYPGETMR